MPTYAYACTACGHAFDAVQKFTDDALTTCPECGGRLRKVYTSIGVTFKGSGFYRNDSRAGTNGSSGSSEKSSEKTGSSEKNSEKSSEKGSSGSSSDTGSTSASSTSSTSSTSSSSGTGSSGSKSTAAAS